MVGKINMSTTNALYKQVDQQSKWLMMASGCWDQKVRTNANISSFIRNTVCLSVHPLLLRGKISRRKTDAPFSQSTFSNLFYKMPKYFKAQRNFSLLYWKSPFVVVDFPLPFLRTKQKINVLFSANSFLYHQLGLAVPSLTASQHH